MLPLQLVPVSGLPTGQRASVSLTMIHSSFYRGLEAAQHLGPPAHDCPDGGLDQPAVRAAAATALLDHLLASTDLRTWACRRGCDSCCHHPVGVTFAEAVGLAAAVEDLGPLTAPLRERIAAAAAATRDVAWEQLAATPCPLLADGSCTVYGARPLACRAFGSTDADACRRLAAGERVDLPFDRAAFGLGLGIGQALGGDHRELRAALAAILATGADDVHASKLAFASARPAGGQAPRGDRPAPPAGDGGR